VTKSTLNNQFDYTRIFLEAAGIGMDNYEYYRRDWWFNPTVPGNLRLSKSGITFVEKHAKITTYQIELANPLLSRTFIQLSRLFTCPYYIKKNNKIVLLGEEETVLLSLHANNLQQYLDNLGLDS
jgi:hypothetical protein